MIRRIYYADDDPDDAFLFREATQEINAALQLEIAENGIKLMSLLLASIKLPDVIFLDINMPLKNGLECLRDIKASTVWKDIPIVMFSTSVDPHTVERAMALGAFQFVQKPAYFPILKDAIESCLTSIYNTRQS